MGEPLFQCDKIGGPGRLCRLLLLAQLLPSQGVLDGRARAPERGCDAHDVRVVGFPLRPDPEVGRIDRDVEAAVAQELGQKVEKSEVRFEAKRLVGVDLDEDI